VPKTIVPIPLTWRPGDGPYHEAATRLQANFGLPKAAMGEAWFLGQRRKMFDSLLSEDLSSASPELTDALETLTSGPISFGALAEWTDWLHYLVGRLPFHMEGWATAGLFEKCVSAFMAHYPGGRDNAPYDMFFDDVLATLGRTVMASSQWHNERLVAGKLMTGIDELAEEPWYWVSAGGALSAALFLTIKYAAAESLDTWWKSVTHIADPVWKADLVLWLAAASPMFLRADPRAASLAANWDYGAGWDCSLHLGKMYFGNDESRHEYPFLTTRQQELMLALFRSTLSTDRLLDWSVSFETLTGQCDGAIIAQSQLQHALEKCVSAYRLP
jgi:hypothetical protein